MHPLGLKLGPVRIILFTVHFDFVPRIACRICPLVYFVTATLGGGYLHKTQLQTCELRSLHHSPCLPKQIQCVRQSFKHIFHSFFTCFGHPVPGGFLVHNYTSPTCIACYRYFPTQNPCSQLVPYNTSSF